MTLLKIGTLNIPNNRWEDSLCVFDDVYVFCFEGEKELSNPHFHYVKFRSNDKINSFLYRSAKHFNCHKFSVFFSVICVWLLRLYNFKTLKRIKKLKVDHVHSSYNDFDESAFLTLLLKPKRFIRAQKETRPNYSFFEKYCFKKASTIVLNDPLNLVFFEDKYGKRLFDGKSVLFDLDEDVRKKSVINSIEHEKKLSEIDGKIHAVILAGRVLSDQNEKRSGGRLFYVNLINALLNNGIIVHLHTGRIVGFNGKNPYLELAQRNSNFHIESKLDFINDTIGPYRVLSRYDIGVCHAHLDGSEVSAFD